MRKAIFTLSIAASVFVNAQTLPKNSVNIADKGDKILVNTLTGVAVVSGDNGVYGISESSTSPIWKIDNAEIYSKSVFNQSDLSGLNLLGEETLVENIYGSPYVIVTKGMSKSVVDTNTGKVLFGTLKEGWAPVNHYMIPNTTTLLVEYVKDKKSYIANVDLATGTIKWTSETGEIGGLVGRLKDLAKRERSAKVYPKLDKEGNVYGYFSGKFIKLNMTDGKVLWQSDQKLTNFDINKTGAYIITISRAGGLGGFLGTKEALNIIDAKTGAPVWKEDKSVGKVVYVEDMGNQFLLASYNGTNLYDYTTGRTQWKKNVKGEPRMMVKSNGGYIFVTKNEMNFIKEDGKELWKREVEISDNKNDEIIELRERNGKIFYITSTYANIVDINNGSKIWKRNIKLEEKRPTFFVYNDANQEYVLYNDEKLYKYNASNTERPEPFAKLRLKKEKEVTDLEIRQNGYLISGMGELAYVDKSGNVVYQKYYDEPGAFGRTFSRIGLNALNVAANIGAAEWVDSQGNSQGGVFFNEENRGLLGGVSETAFYLDSSMKTRFNASNQVKDYKFFFTKDGANKVLVKVNKDTGAEEGKFLFNNNKPVYTIDEYSGTIYYINGNKIDVFKY